MKRATIFLIAVIGSLLLTGCKDDNPVSPAAEIIVSENITVNPTGYAPLTATIELETETPVQIRLRVIGKNGSDSDVVHEFDRLETNFEIPILGLYADYNNQVELTFFGSAGNEIGTKSYEIQTDSLISDLPDIEINVANTSQMVEEMTLVSYFGYRVNGNQFPQRPFIFDTFGDIRWYLDYSQHPSLSNLFYDDGMERLRNGNLYFGDGATDRIFEVNMLGKVVETWDMPGYGFHHEVTEKPNGNFLVTVNEIGSETIEDVIIEINRESKQVINVWDLKESLDYDRTTWTDDRVDWIHVNALTYDESDNTIIISGRTQGVIKLTENNEVVWILAPHRGWGESGNDTDLNQFLLQPLDSNGEAITDTTVLQGGENHPDFEWNWYQHAPLIMPNGNLMLFDNGDERNYTGSEQYSRAVEYEINEEEMTVKQIWSYGKERGPETYSRIVSDVDYLPDENHVIFSPGAIDFGSTYGKAIEVGYDQQQVIFEATITPPQPLFIITFHRTERLSIYP